MLFSVLVGIVSLVSMRATLAADSTGAGNQQPQFQIEVKVMEMDASESKPLGFDWQLGQISTNGMAPASSGVPATGSISGILTDPQFRVVMRSLEHGSNSRLLASIQGPVLAGGKLETRQPDGWIFRVIPMPAPTGGVYLEVEIEKKTGEFAGFGWNSRAIAASGESMMFRSVFNSSSEKEKKAKSSEERSLAVFVTAKRIEL
jgi:hypothetical protein